MKGLLMKQGLGYGLIINFQPSFMENLVPVPETYGQAYLLATTEDIRNDVYTLNQIQCKEILPFLSDEECIEVVIRTKNEPIYNFQTFQEVPVIDATGCLDISRIPMTLEEHAKYWVRTAKPEEKTLVNAYQEGARSLYTKRQILESKIQLLEGIKHWSQVINASQRLKDELKALKDEKDQTKKKGKSGLS